MQTTVTLDDDLLARARDATGIEEDSALVQAALRSLLHSRASKALIRLGGSDPGATAARRPLD